MPYGRSRRAIRRISRRLKLQLFVGACAGTTAYWHWQWSTWQDNEAHSFFVNDRTTPLQPNTSHSARSSTRGGGIGMGLGARHEEEEARSSWLPRNPFAWQGGTSSSSAESTEAAPIMAPGELLGGHPATFYNESTPREPCKLRGPLLRNGRDDPSAEIYDVVVIGGGLAGLQTALLLSEKHGKRVMVLEGKRIGVGASGRNGGDAIVGFHMDNDELCSYLRNDVKLTEALYQQTVDGYNRLLSTIKNYRIQCDASEVGAVTLSFAKPHLKEREEEKTALKVAFAEEDVVDRWEKYGERLEVWSKEKLQKAGFSSDRFSYGLFNPMNISLNPLELTLGLARACEQNKVEIHEASPALSIKTGTEWKTNQTYQIVTTPLGSVKAQHVVIATNKCPPGLSRTVSWATTPVMTGMMVTKPLPKKQLDEVLSGKFAVFDERYGLSYFRRVPGNRILYGALAEPIPFHRTDLMTRLCEDLATTFPTLAPFVEADRTWQGRIETRYPVFPLVGKIYGDTASSSVWFNLGYAGHGLVPTVAGANAVVEQIVTKGEDRSVYPTWAKVNFQPPIGRAPDGSATSPALWPVGGPWGPFVTALALKAANYSDSLKEPRRPKLMT